MAEQMTQPVSSPIDLMAVDRAHALAARDALLEHARMGREIHEWRDGKIVTVTPAEIFARCGFDEFGRPLDKKEAHG
jgi:hypothetical protein